MLAKNMYSLSLSSAAVEWPRWLLSALLDVKIAQVDGDQEQVADGFRPRAPRKSSAFGRKPKSVRPDNVVHVLRDRKPTGDLQPIVMTPEEKVRPEIEFLFRAVARDARRKPNAKSAPNLGALLPGLDLRHVETRHCHEERRRQVSPSRIAIEIRHLHEVPRRRQRVPDEGLPGIGSLLDDLGVHGLDHDPVRSKPHAPLGPAIAVDAQSLLVDCRDAFRR